METIPMEVGALILEHVPDMASLWAFIRASPNISSAFRDFREQILQIVIARDIGPDLMIEGLAALDSSRFTTIRRVDGKDAEVYIRGPKSQALGWMENYYLPRSGVMRWVDRYLSDSDRQIWEEWKESHQVEESEKSPPKEDMLSLWKLHQDVMFIANLYVREALPIFTQSFRSPFDSSPVPQIECTLDDTSFIEIQRIYRGVYRFVILGNLFTPSAEVWGYDEQCEQFLCRFQGWEVEEISCINDFIKDKIAQKWKELGDHEFKRLIASGFNPESDAGNRQEEADERTMQQALTWKLISASALPI